MTYPNNSKRNHESQPKNITTMSFKTTSHTIWEKIKQILTIKKPMFLMPLKQMLVTHNDVKKFFQPEVILVYQKNQKSFSLMPLFDSALLLTQQHLEKISSSLHELVILIFSPKDSLVFAKALILQQK